MFNRGRPDLANPTCTNVTSLAADWMTPLMARPQWEEPQPARCHSHPPFCPASPRRAAARQSPVLPPDSFLAVSSAPDISMVPISRSDNQYIRTFLCLGVYVCVSVCVRASLSLYKHKFNLSFLSLSLSLSFLSLSPPPSSSLLLPPPPHPLLQNILIIIIDFLIQLSFRC